MEAKEIQNKLKSIGYEDLSTYDSPCRKLSPVFNSKIFKNEKNILNQYKNVDNLCNDLEINPDIETGNKKLDKFFKTEFDPATGMWIRNHPELNKITELYKSFYKPS